MTIEIHWFGVASVESLSWHDKRLLKYFNVRPHRGLMSEFDVQTQHQIVPYSLTPTDGLHRLLSRTVDGGSELNRLPYFIENQLGSHPLRIVSITGELFPGGVLVTKVKGRLDYPESGGWFEGLYSELRKLRTPRSATSVDSIMRRFIGVARGGPEFPTENISYRDYFLFQITSEAMYGTPPSEAFHRNLVALLTDAARPQDLGGSVIDFVIDENRTLNEKAESEVLLINRQGGVYFLPSEPYSSPNRHRFKKASELATIALFANQFLGDHVGFRNRQPVMANFIKDQIRRFIELPELVFASSFANHHTWERLSESLKLQLRLDDWESQVRNRESHISDTIDDVPERWWEIRDFETRLENDAKSLKFPDPAN
ncbi:hypothetical protein D8S82_29915 [Mycobacterium hodleri]|uniref:Uncharacterized protein n=1 Tax=Mycolicibacterium hodleri TaxID=49897 RepID=A0A544VSA9_9MYCO|nr:hypothetical protein [Mycolicibacterium hodleri]TQR82860.1 hypothetical protein D8S82_29915 [Mycolicibacterium hodleri]